MKLLVIALAAALTIFYLKRRRRPEPWSAPMPEPYEPTPRSVPPPQSESPTEPVSPVDTTPMDESVTVPFAFEQGTVPGPLARERESEATEETRFDRLGQVEQDERSEAAARLRDDPLVRRNEDETP